MNIAPVFGFTQFAWPWVFALLPLPLILRWLLPPEKSDAAALRVPFFRHLADANAASRGISRARVVPLALIWCCLVFAAARPQLLGEIVKVPVVGRDLMLAVDVSGSMRARDMLHNGVAQTRLQAVKRVAGEFISRRVGDRIGLILFGTQAYLQTPLTLDRTAARQLLDEAVLGIAGNNTAIGDAIGLAIKRFQAQEQIDAADKILILLTDGEDTASQVAPIQAAELAKSVGLKIHSVGIGSRTARGLDEATLQFVAQQTGGKYFRAANAASLEKIYATIDALEPVEQEGNELRPTREVFYQPLTLALALGLISLIWRLARERIGLRRDDLPAGEIS